MGRPIKPLQADKTTRQKLLNGYRWCGDPHRRRHWLAIYYATGFGLDEFDLTTVARLGGVAEWDLKDAYCRARGRLTKGEALRHAGANPDRVRQLEGPRRPEDVALLTGTSESQVRRVTARFAEEGFAYLERPFRHRRPGHKGHGRRATLTADQLRQLSLDERVIEGALADVRGWIGVQTGKAISLSVASRLRAKAKQLRESH